MLKAESLPPSCAFLTNSGNLNFLEPSGPVQACNGTALPFILDVWGHVVAQLLEALRYKPEGCGFDSQ